MVIESWRAVSAAQVRRDPRAARQRQDRFAQTLFEATGHNPSRVRAVRAVARESFLRELRDPRAVLTQLAARHHLAGADTAVYVDDAMRVGWFDLRWERLALRTPTDGTQIETIDTTLLRISRPSQRSFIAWALSANCLELLGNTDRRATPADTRVCAEIRRELLPVAVGINRDYPRDEARAAIEMLFATGLLRVSDPTRTESGQALPIALEPTATAHDEALAAFSRARDLYASLLGHARDRRLLRYYRATVAELARE